jgi:hypothetical protein
MPDSSDLCTAFFQAQKGYWNPPLTEYNEEYDFFPPDCSVNGGPVDPDNPLQSLLSQSLYGGTVGVCY